MSITNAIAAPTNQGWERRTKKPVSAATSNTAANNSAIRPNSCDVIMAIRDATGTGHAPSPLDAL
jgi:hypothetical protein